MLAYISSFFSYIFNWFSSTTASSEETEQTEVLYDDLNLGFFALPALHLQAILSVLDKYKQIQEQTVSVNRLAVENEISVLKIEADGYKQKLEETQAEKVAIHEQFQIERTSLLNQLTETRNNEKLLSISKGEAEKQRICLDKQMVEIAKECQQLRDQQAEAEEERTRLNSEISSLHANLNDINETVKGVYETITGLTAQKEEAEANLTLAREEMVKLSFEKEKLTSIVKTHEMEIMVLNKQIEYSRARSTMSNASTSSPTTSVTSYSSRYTCSVNGSPSSANSSPVSTRSCSNSLHGSPVSTPPLQDVSNQHLSRVQQISKSSSPLLIKTLTSVFNDEEQPLTPTRKLRL
jgi:DNA repair exonuclease SbcCD ATPase subunit